MRRFWARDTVLGLLAAAVAVVVCARAPWRDFPRLVAASGPRLATTLVMWPVALACDAWAWRVLLRALGVTQASWRALWVVRLVSEAVLLSWPGGSVLAEIVKVGLLVRWCGAHVAPVAASVAVKKVLVIASEAPYLALAAWAAGVEAHSERHGAVLGPFSGPWSAAGLLALPAIAALIVLIVALMLGRLSARRGWADRLASAASSPRVLQGRFSSLARPLTELRGADEHVRHLWRAPAILLPASLAVFMAWLCEGADLWLASWALGDPLRPWQALYCDACAGFVRAAAFVVPGGWGAQDVGLAGLLTSVAQRTDHAAAWLVVMKRAKEVFFVVTGYSLGFAIKAAWRKDRQELT